MEYMFPYYYVAPVAQDPGRKHCKHKFTPEEDERLSMLVKQFGETNWRKIADAMVTRNYRQCRERWKNYLAPNVCRDPWTAEEDRLLQDKYQELGSRWSLIAKFFPNRTDVSLKNRWVVLTSHTVQEKRVRRNKKSQEPVAIQNMDQFLQEVPLYEEDDDTFLLFGQYNELCSF